MSPNEERVRQLAELAGITVAEEDLREVANRLMHGLGDPMPRES